MTNEPISYLSVNGLAIAMFAVSALIALIIVKLRELREESEQLPINEDEEILADEPPPKYDEEAPPLYAVDLNDIDGRSHVYLADLKANEESLVCEQRNISSGCRTSS